MDVGHAFLDSVCHPAGSRFDSLNNRTGIDPRDVEDVLVRHEGIGQVAVIGVPDDKLGEEVAAVVIKACEIPPASTFASPTPLIMMTENTLIIPMTVPSKPSKGEIPAIVPRVFKNLSSS